MFVTAAPADNPVTPSGAIILAAVGEAAPPAAHGEVVGIEGGTPKGVFPPMDSTYFASQLLWLAISFGLFYLVLQKVILPRIGAIIENRRDRIALDLAAAERMKLDADAALAAYEQDLAAARDNSHKIAAMARESAKADADTDRARVEADLDAKLDAAQARIASIKQAALADLDTVAEEATQDILAAVAGLDVSRQDVSGAVRSVRS